MEYLKNIQKFLLGVLTFMCIVILTIDITCFSLKKVSEKYLKEDKIKEVIDDINVLDLFKDENGNELEQIKEVKNQIVDAGIPKESIDGFINSKPVNDFAGTVITDSINNISSNKEIINDKKIYSFLEDNIGAISKELQENNVPKSEFLTVENQEKFFTFFFRNQIFFRHKFSSFTVQVAYPHHYASIIKQGGQTCIVPKCHFCDTHHRFILVYF